MTTTPPGWYDDGQGALRWWNGSQWTESVAAPAAEGIDGHGADKTARTDEGLPSGALPTASGYGSGAETWAPPSGRIGVGAVGVVVPAAADTGYRPDTPPPKSRLWILWVALGVGLLGILLAAALLFPSLLSTLTSPEPGQDDVASESSDGAGVLAPAAEEGAVAAVKTLDHAWQSADCDEYFAVTTEEYRVLTEMETCELFYRRSREFMASVVDFTSTVGKVAPVGSAVAVSTTDRYDAYWDKDGEPTESLHPYTDRIEYLVVEVDGEWRIDDWFFD